MGERLDEYVFESFERMYDGFETQRGDARFLADHRHPL